MRSMQLLIASLKVARMYRLQWTPLQKKEKKVRSEFFLKVVKPITLSV